MMISQEYFQHDHLPVQRIADWHGDERLEAAATSTSDEATDLDIATASEALALLGATKVSDDDESTGTSTPPMTPTELQAALAEQWGATASSGSKNTVTAPSDGPELSPETWNERDGALTVPKEDRTEENSVSEPIMQRIATPPNTPSDRIKVEEPVRTRPVERHNQDDLCLNDSNCCIILGQNDSRGITNKVTRYYKDHVRGKFDRTKPKSVAEVMKLFQGSSWDGPLSFWVSEEKAQKCHAKGKERGECRLHPCHSTGVCYGTKTRGARVNFVRACEDCIKSDIEANRVQKQRTNAKKRRGEVMPESREEASAKKQKVNTGAPRMCVGTALGIGPIPTGFNNYMNRENNRGSFPLGRGSPVSPRSVVRPEPASCFDVKTRVLQKSASRKSLFALATFDGGLVGADFYFSVLGPTGEVPATDLRRTNLEIGKSIVEFGEFSNVHQAPFLLIKAFRANGFETTNDLVTFD